MTFFFQLLNIALGQGCELDRELSDKEWDDILALAKKQSVVGLLSMAMMRLPDTQKPYRRIKIEIALIAEKIANRNMVMDAHVAEISKSFSSLGLHSCLLKGQGISLLYPDPAMRQCGDIDLWVKNDDYRNVLERVSSVWKTGQVWYHHVDVYAFDDEVALEVHFMPSWMNSPCKNRLLQNYFQSVAPTQFNNFNEKLGCNVPTSEFNLVFCLVHIYRHLLFEGIGLRQLTDYFLILKHSTEDERRTAYMHLKSFGVGKFAAAVMYIMGEFFSLDRELMLVKPDCKRGKFLMKEVMIAGNFGQYNTRNHYKKTSNILKRATDRLRYLSRFILFAPSEVLWAPYFKVRQYFWKKFNNYK